MKQFSKKNTLLCALACCALAVAAMPTDSNSVNQVFAGNTTSEITKIDKDPSYDPTAIVNGDFSVRPWHDYKYNDTWYYNTSTEWPTENVSVQEIKYNTIGWNTSDMKLWKGTNFEWITNNADGHNYNISSARTKSGVDYPYNSSSGILDPIVAGTNIGCVEMNANTNAVFYQDLKTYSRDIIRWTLKHGARTENVKGITPEEQIMHAEVGATPKDTAGNITQASGANSGITGESLAIYKSTALSTDLGKYGYGTVAELKALALNRTKSDDANGWHTATGVYVVPNNQLLTRFAFISDIDSAYGNLLDDVTFDTIIGNLHAYKNEEGNVVITGYWGDVNLNKHLVIDVNGEKISIDMNKCIEEQFNYFQVVVEDDAFKTATSMKVYHEDYPDATTTIDIVHPHTWQYSASGATLSAYCVKSATESDHCNYQGSSNAVTVSVSASNMTYSGSAYSNAKVINDTDWKKSGQKVPTIYYVSQDGTSYAESTTAPKNVGKYYAEIKGTNSDSSVAVAKVAFEITKQTIDKDKLSVAAINDVTYDGTAKTPDLSITYKSSPLVKNTDYTATYSNNTNVGTANVSISFIGNYSGSTSTTFKIVPASTSVLDASLEYETVTYDGTAKTPSVTVKYNGSTISASDYTVSYANNTNVGTANVTITFKSGKNFTGKIDKTFTITQSSSLSDITTTLQYTTTTYDGTAKTPSVTLTYKGSTISSNDYTVNYSNNTNVGTAGVTITFKDSANFKGTINKSFKITKSSDVSSVVTTLEYLTTTYDGTAKTPSVTLTYKGNEISSNDYTVSYSNNVDAGTAGVAITFKDSANFTGTINKTFTITKSKDFSEITTTLGYLTTTYDGTAKTPSVTLTYKGNTIPSSDYKVEYKDNINAGTATITITFNNGADFEGSYTKTFEITKSTDLSGITTTLGYTTTVYNGNEKKPSVTLSFGGNTIPSTDYSVTYSNNVNVGTAGVEIEFKEGANFSGKINKTFSITKSSDLSSITTTLEYETTVYDGTAKTPSVTLTHNGNEISANDYKVTYSKNIQVGTAGVEIEFKSGANFSGKINKTFTITKNSDLSEITTTLEYETTTYSGTAKTPGVTLTYKGNNIASSTYGVEYTNNINAGIANVKITFNNTSDFSGYIEKTFTISPNSNLTLVTCLLDFYTTTYDGTAKTPSVTLIYNGEIISSDSYTVTYSDNTNVGTAGVKIEFKSGANFSGIINESFTITPSTDLSSITTTLEYLSTTYDGTAKTPGVTLTYKSEEIDSSTYEVSYFNNVNKGTASVAITFKTGANFQGTINKSFYINANTDLSDITTTLEYESIAYDGNEKTPSVTLTYKGNTIPSSTYDVNYANNIKAGTASVTITFNSSADFSGVINKSFTITASSDLSGITSSLDFVTTVYDATAKTPGVTLVYKGQQIDTSTYEVSYSDNVNVGTAKVVITFKEGADFTGTINESFTITPSTDLSSITTSLEYITTVYDGSEKTPSVTLTYKGEIIDSSNYEVNYSNNINRGIANAAITFKSGANFTGTINKAFNISASSDLTGITTTLEYETTTYDGSEKTPSVTLTFKGNEIPSSSYGVIYSNNINAGSASVAITFNSTANFTGTINKSFTISANTDLGEITTTLGFLTTVYDGSEKTPSVTLTYKGHQIDSSSYEVVYSNNVNAGTANVEITFKPGANFEGTIQETFTITPATDLTGITSSLEYETTTYNGEEKKPTVSLVYLGEIIDATTYQVTYSNNINRGIAGVEITFLDGANFSGTINKSFTITASSDLSGITTTLEYETTTYDGSEKTPSVTLTFKGNEIPSSSYDVVYGDNVHAGTASVTITFKSDANFSGVINDDFTITRSTDLSDIEVSLEYETTVFDGSEKKPSVTVTYKGNAISANDYEVNYSDNINAGTATVKVTFKDSANFEGTVTEYFEITASSDLSEIISSLEYETTTYNGEEKKPTVTLTYKGNEVDATTYEVSYSNNINAGSASVVITFLDGANFKGQINKSFTITPSTDFSEIISSLEYDSVTYDGEEKKPTVTLTYKGNEVDATTYEVSYANNINAGEADVIITFKANGNFSGSFTIHFTILPTSDLSEVEGELEYETTVYDATEKTPFVTITYKGDVVDASSYVVTYSNNIDAGTAYVAVTFNSDANFEGTVNLEFEITPSSDLGNIVTTLEYDTTIYDGTEKKPAVELVYEGITLEASNYDVIYDHNINRGTAGVTITFKPSGNFIGSILKNFTITPNTDLSGITTGLEYDQTVYDGTEKTPYAVLIYKGVVVDSDTYTVAYSENIVKGTARVAITFKSTANFVGTLTRTFIIMASHDISDIIISLEYEETNYDGSEKTPEVYLEFHGESIDPIFYTKVYSDNILPGSANVVITFTEDAGFIGTIGRSFTINKGSASDVVVTLEYTSTNYDGTEKTPGVTVTHDGVEFLPSEYSVEYANNINPGIADVIVTLLEESYFEGSVTEHFRIGKIQPSELTGSIEYISVTYDGTEKTPTVTIKFGSKDLVEGVDFTVTYTDNVNVGDAKAEATLANLYEGVMGFSFTITPKDSSNLPIRLENTEFPHTGEEIKPSVEIKDGDYTLVRGKDYYVTYSDNTDVGRGKMRIEFTGNYAGNESRTFDIIATGATDPTLCPNHVPMIVAIIAYVAFAIILWFRGKKHYMNLPLFIASAILLVGSIVSIATAHCETCYVTFAISIVTESFTILRSLYQMKHDKVSIKGAFKDFCNKSKKKI